LGRSRHVGAAFDFFFVKPLQRVCAAQFAAVLLGEAEMGHHIGLAVVDKRGELRLFRPRLVGDVPQHLAGFPIRLQERLAQCRRHYALLGLGDVGEGVAHRMHAAALPGGT
jgi:hypothetical protein